MKILTALLVAAFALLAFAQNVRIDGSSTVYPISLAVAEEFQILNPEARVTVAFSGTGGGLEKFCAGETDISDASRVIKQGEIDACTEAGVEFVELPVAIDALTVVVNNENDWVQCLTTDQLATIFAPDSTVQAWSDVNPEWPDEEIEFFIPGTDSGTFDYFTEAIVGESGASRTDVFPSEDDNVLVQGVEGNQYAIGYFGYAYYVENRERVKAVAIDSGEGCVLPSEEVVVSGEYSPLSRPLFIYVSAVSAEQNPTVVDLVDFYLSEDARFLIASTGYVTYADEVYAAIQERWESRVTGSAFQDFAPGDDVLSTIREGLE